MYTAQLTVALAAAAAAVDKLLLQCPTLNAATAPLEYPTATAASCCCCCTELQLSCSSSTAKHSGRAGGSAEGPLGGDSSSESHRSVTAVGGGPACNCHTALLPLTPAVAAKVSVLAAVLLALLLLLLLLSRECSTSVPSSSMAISVRCPGPGVRRVTKLLLLLLLLLLLEVLLLRCHSGGLQCRTEASPPAMPIQ
jgi:hypothetical protein